MPERARSFPLHSIRFHRCSGPARRGVHVRPHRIRPVCATFQIEEIYCYFDSRKRYPPSSIRYSGPQRSLARTSRPSPETVPLPRAQPAIHLSESIVAHPPPIARTSDTASPQTGRAHPKSGTGCPRPVSHVPASATLHKRPPLAGTLERKGGPSSMYFQYFSSDSILVRVVPTNRLDPSST